MIKRRLKTTFSRIWPKRIAPRILYYHSVHPALDYSITPALFAKHLDWLLAKDYQLTTFSELARCVQGGSAAAKQVCITFDDGYMDNYEYALPILVDRHIPATFFVVTSLVGDSHPLCSNSGNKLYRDRAMLTRSQLEEMHVCEMEIGSHTRSHVHVKKTLHQSEHLLTAELAGSRKDLEDMLGISITCFAYPNGQKGVFDNDTAKHVQSAGYQFAATTIWGAVTLQTDPMEIPRMEVEFDDSVSILERKITGRYDYMRYYASLRDRSRKW